jgi:signal transduction histidine kinase
MLRSRLTLLFLGAVEVTFLSAVAALWGLRSWRVVTDDMTLLHAQSRRLGVVHERLAARPPALAADARLAAALRGLGRHAQTLDETERVRTLAATVQAQSPAAVGRAARRLGRWYRGEQGRLRRQGDFLARASNGLTAGIVGLVIAAFVVFLAAIRVWLVEPVRTLERATEVMSTGDLTHRIVLPGRGELTRLAASINSMATSLARIQTQLLTSERFALLGELSAYVAHNIRNPLASIRTTAQGEAIHLEPDDPRRGAFEDIVRAADRLNAWVSDLLRSASPIVLERRAGSLGDLVARCAELARPRLRAAGVELEVAVSPTPAVSFDEAKLEQVVSAVLANASDASPRGGRVRVSVEPDGQAIALRVADEGPGIPPERRARLFTPFATTKASGTGIGLWLSQKIVVAHGGTMTLLNGGGGTTVELRLPTAPEAACRAS